MVRPLNTNYRARQRLDPIHRLITFYPRYAIVSNMALKVGLGRMALATLSGSG
jgi:hypothetical protein